MRRAARRQRAVRTSGWTGTLSSSVGRLVQVGRAVRAHLPRRSNQPLARLTIADRGRPAASRADFSGGGEVGFVLGVACPYSVRVGGETNGTMETKGGQPHAADPSTC